MNKIIAFVGAFLAVMSAQASILNWQVTETDFGGQSVSGANLYANVSGGSATAIGGQLGTSVAFSDATGYESFYVELVNASGDAIARSGTETYSDLASKGFIAEGASEVAMATWHPSGYTACPEPTSALLMMMGVAFLGLKRRKA